MTTEEILARIEEVAGHWSAIGDLPWSTVAPFAVALLEKLDESIANPLGKLAIEEVIHLVRQAAGK